MYSVPVSPRKLACGFFAIALSLSAESLSFIGTTDKNPLEYKIGETMTFTVTLVDKSNDNSAVYGKELKWSLKDDGGQSKSGTATSDSPLVVTHSMTNAGFTRLTVNVITNGVTLTGNTEVFDGGAGADVMNIREWPRPIDFDSFWDNAAKTLLATPLEPTLTPYAPSDGNADVEYYVYSIPTVGDAAYSAATGIIAMPKGSKAGDNLGIIFHTFGYGYRGKTDTPSTSEVYSSSGNNIVVHSTRWGENPIGDDAYYTAFEAETTTTRGWRNTNKTIQDLDQYAMHIRNLRALQYAKSRPEWNGKDIRLRGGSLGGYQALCLAGLDNQVSDCTVSVPWSVDLGGVNYGRMAGWRPGWTENLDYVDAKNFAQRITAPVTFSAGLGDYTCPPSGQVQLYRNIRMKKKATFTQNTAHGSNRGPSGTCANYVLEDNAGETTAEAQVVRRTMEFIGGSGSWKVASNWRDTVGKTNDLPRATDIISLPKAANNAKNDWQGFEAYQLNLSAFNSYNSASLPIILDASGGGIQDTGYIYCAMPIALRGTNVPFSCTQLLGMTSLFSSADGQPCGIVKKGKSEGGLTPTANTSPETYAGLKYIDIAEGTFVYNINDKVNDAKLALFPSDMVITFSGLNTKLGINGNLVMTNLWLRETGNAIGHTHTISTQAGTKYTGSLTVRGTMPVDETVFTGTISGSFGFTWEPTSASQSFAFSGDSASVAFSKTLRIKNGAVKFRDGAYVNGVGELRLDGANARLEFAGTPAKACTTKHLRLTTAAARLALAEGVTLTADTAFVIDTVLVPGTYTSANAAWIEGAGTLVVKETCHRRLYWRGKTADVSRVGDGGKLANWAELCNGALVDATLLPQGGDTIVINNNYATKALATTASFNNANKSKGLASIVFEGSNVNNDTDRAIIWGEGDMYINGDAILTNDITVAKTTRIWENTHVVGNGSGVRIGTSLSDSIWWQERTLSGNVPVIVDSAGTVTFCDYNPENASTHDAKGQAYSRNYSFQMPELQILRGTAEFRDWYKLTNTVVRFMGAGTSLVVGFGKADAGYHDLWFGSGALLSADASLAAGSYTIRPTSGKACGLHFRDCPGVLAQTFCGKLSGALDFDFMPASSAYSFTFSGATSDTTGSLIVSNGTVRLTNGAKFTALTKVEIGPTGSLSVGKGSSIAAKTFDIGVSGISTGKVVIAKGSRLSLASLTVNGAAVETGIYDKTSGWISGDGKVAVGDLVWPDDKTAVWNRDDFPHAIAATTWYDGISLYGENMDSTDLTASSGAQVYLGAKGIASTTSAKRYSFGWPIVLSGNQTWMIGDGNLIDFFGPLSSHVLGTITVAGTTGSKQTIFWTESDCEHEWYFGKNTTVVLRNAEGLGTGGVTIDNGILRPCGGDVPNAITFTNIDNIACINAMDNTSESTFLGPIALPYENHSRINASKAPLRFKGTVSKPRGYIYLNSGGTYSFDAPVSFRAGALQFNGATLYLNAATNDVGWNNFQFGSYGRLYTTVPYALSSATEINLNMNVDKSGQALWDLCGCDQSVIYVKGGPCSVITSATEAVVHTRASSDYANHNNYKWDNTAYSAGVPTNYVCFTGGAGLSVEGKGYLRLANLSSTTGTLTVAGGGLVEMAAKQVYQVNGQTYVGQWPNASEVNVTSGTLDIQHSKAFGRNTVVGLSGDNSKIKLSFKGKLKVGGFVRDGERFDSGSYGSLTSAANVRDSRFEGDGILVVGKQGLAVIVK